MHCAFNLMLNKEIRSDFYDYMCLCHSQVIYMYIFLYFLDIFISARQWWQFSITCIMQSIKERNMRQTWSFAVKRAHDIVKYVNIYSQHLTSATVEPLLKVSVLFICLQTELI